MQQTAPDHARERYRLVSRADEVVSVLDNGATVIAKRVASPVVAVRAYVRTGGAFEGPWLGGGLSHLLEHLVAGGSTDRRTEAENRNLLQQIGNNSNAYTSDDQTAYFINTTSPHYEQAIDLVTGWLLGAKITPDEYAREYQVVQRELEMGKGDPDRQFYYLANANRYRVSPARVPVIGYQEVIQGLGRDDVYAYYKLAYQPQNMVFSVAGDVDPEAMLAAFKTHLAAAKPGRGFDRDLPAEPAVVTPRTVVATFPKLGQAKVQVAFPTIRLDSPDLYALDLLSAVLSAGDSAVLTEDLRDKRQLVSSVTSYSHTPDYVEGTFAVAFECDPDKVQAATDAARAVLRSARETLVDADRLARAKTQMRVARVRGLQTAEEIASSLANDYLTTGDPHFTDTYLDRVEQVTPEQVRAVAQRYLADERLLTTVMLPAETAPRGLPQAVDLVRPAAPTTAPAGEAAQGPAGVVRTQLDDGTVLLVKRITASPLVAVRMYAFGGVTAEDAGNNGIGHLTMEMLTRGTADRGTTDRPDARPSRGG
ncbi:MAG TPA: insulinase family protein, partial [Tepidisphaeraceae bacterium]|nr:insulinase family protein [Tepidisphaeraceae bacterium]